MKWLLRFKDFGGISVKCLCMNVREIMVIKCLLGRRRGGGLVCWVCVNLWEII